MPIRLMASLLYLKHSFNLSDEDVCERWHVTGRFRAWRSCAAAEKISGR